ncbi:MAG: branched-chain amino acid ABC transporter permease [Firmicutes bacterium]|nr:branched-chain amino acid ABC transporter permease [Bacillota bacterium]
MFLEQVIAGLTLGSTYALLALGYSMVFGVLSFVNFAHGDVAVVGAYLAWLPYVNWGWGFLPSMLFGIAGGVALGVFMEKIGYVPLRKASRLAAILVSLGFSFVIATMLQLTFTTEPKHMPEVFEIHTYQILNTSVNSVQGLILLLSLVFMSGLHLFVQKTRVGMVMRATSLDKDTAGLMGVNVNNVISLTFAIGSGLGVIAAIMIAIYYGTVYPTMGSIIGIKAFTAVILGGAGSIPGAVVGGLLMGLVESLGGAYISTAYTNAIAFFMLILTLLLRPAGLLGRTISKV